MSTKQSGSYDLVSLATAFAMAGTPAIVASLWEVGDESTAELMATFYRALEGSTDRLDALRNAKLNLLRMKRGNATPYAGPWHWSGFQLYGDFRAAVAK
jgi:CHAT domain-containing protein